MQLEKLLKKLRGKDYRAAYGTIPQLRRADDGSLAATVASYKPKDEGIEGLARRWLSLGTDEQRRTLLQEISGDEWTAEGTVELAIAALEEPDDQVRGYALLCAKAAVEGEKMRASSIPSAFSGSRNTSSCSA